MEPGLVRRARQHPDRTAILAEGARFSYRDLLRASAGAAGRLLQGAADLKEKRVAFLLPPGFSHVATQWGIWRAGGIAVPLCTAHSAAGVGIRHPGLRSPPGRLSSQIPCGTDPSGRPQGATWP